MDEAQLRCLLRRGMRELDVLLLRYHQRHYPAACATERRAFQRLLTEVEDPEILAWVMGQATAPPEFADVVAGLRQHS